MLFCQIVDKQALGFIDCIHVGNHSIPFIGQLLQQHVIEVAHPKAVGAQADACKDDPTAHFFGNCSFHDNELASH